MNPFLIVAAVLDLGAAGWYSSQGDWKLAVVWFSYAVSTFILSFISGK